MLMDWTLNTHLKEIQETDEKRVNLIIDRLKEKKQFGRRNEKYRPIILGRNDELC